MDSINSVSKGVFVFKNGLSVKELRKKKNNKKIEIVNKINDGSHWYQSYKLLWSEIEQKIEKIQSESYGKILDNLLSYIQDVNFNDPNLQTAVLLTGVNQIDHFKQFDSLSMKIINNCYSLVTILNSRDCSNVKSAIESLVSGLINCKKNTNDEDEENIHVKLKKKQYTLTVLEAWYKTTFKDSEIKPKLVIMLTDFEQFNPLIIQELVSILCSYTSRLPLILILGIATAFKTLHNVLPFHITSKITVNVFEAESSTLMLNRILDEVILTHHCPFFLSGKSFKVLMDIFLFYDYSIHSFIQGFKMFMIEQYSSNFFSSVYHEKGQWYEGMIDEMTHEQCMEIRRNCPSFRRYVENENDRQKRIDLITDDEKLKKLVYKCARKFYRFFYNFFCTLRILAVLIEDLPRNNLGKLHRELYPICSSVDITKLEEFQECFKLLRFTSKEKFLNKIDKTMKILEEFLSDESVSDVVKNNMRTVSEKLTDYREKIANAGMSPVKMQDIKSTPKSSNTPEVNKKGTLSRQEMMAKLKESATNNPTRVVIEYEKLLCECLDFLNQTFESNLRPFDKGPVFIDVLIFSEANSIRRQLSGAPRGALHNALSNPHHYLQCKCCTLRDHEQILPTIPDIAIAYKLHLECNKHINLFDWLQAFALVIENSEDENISSEIQARFTRATAELQFLGYIKQAKHKTDHVMRLTW